MVSAQQIDDDAGPGGEWMVLTQQINDDDDRPDLNASALGRPTQHSARSALAEGWLAVWRSISLVKVTKTQRAM